MLSANVRAAIGIALLVLAFGSGWAVNGWRHDAAQKNETRAVAKETAESIVQSAVLSQRVETAIQEDATRVDKITVAVRERIARNTPERNHDLDLPRLQHPAEPEVAAPCADRAGDPVLDTGTVRLLNAARTGAVQPAAVLADEERAAAGAAR
jgi:hypothetical protein